MKCGTYFARRETGKRRKRITKGGKSGTRLPGSRLVVEVLEDRCVLGAQIIDLQH